MGFKVWVLGLRVWGSGFGVLGEGFGQAGCEQRNIKRRALCKIRHGNEAFDLRALLCNHQLELLDLFLSLNCSVEVASCSHVCQDQPVLVALSVVVILHLEIVVKSLSSAADWQRVASTSTSQSEAL